MMVAGYGVRVLGVKFLSPEWKDGAWPLNYSLQSEMMIHGSSIIVLGLGWQLAKWNDSLWDWNQ